MSQPTITSVPPGTTNRTFLEQFARPGRVGLCGGDTLIDRGIARAERHATPDGAWSRWTHAFVFGEQCGDERGEEGVAERVVVLWPRLHERVRRENGEASAKSSPHRSCG